MALLVGPRGPVLRPVRTSSIVGFAFALGLAALAAPTNAADINVILDHDGLVKLPEKVATVVIGNPLIVGTSLQPGGLMVLTGKGYGSTNIIALDRSGAVLMEKTIEVRAPRDTVVVYKGINRETYSCTPFCEPRIMLGDSQPFFESAIGQVTVRSGLAQGIAPASK